MERIQITVENRQDDCLKNLTTQSNKPKTQFTFLTGKPRVNKIESENDENTADGAIPCCVAQSACHCFIRLASRSVHYVLP